MRLLVALLSLTLGIFFSQNGIAARVDSLNTIWFDSNNNVIGQDAYFCNNAHVQGGAQTGAYKLVIKGGCGDEVESCTMITINSGTQETGITCTTAGYHRTVSQMLFGNFGTVTLQQACDITNACTFQEPELMTGWGFGLGS